MIAEGQMTLPEWACRPWSPQIGRTLVRRGLVLSAVGIALCFAGTWLAGAFMDSCQRLVAQGLTASHNLESSLAPGEPRVSSGKSRFVECWSGVQGASEALQARSWALSWLVPQNSADEIAKVSSKYRDVVALLPADGLPFKGSATQRQDLQNKVHDLAGALLRVSTSVTDGKAAIQRLFLSTIFAACLLVLLLSIGAVLYSDSTVRSAAHFLDGFALQMSNGETFRSAPQTMHQELGQLPEQLAGFSESFHLLARLLQGHCQVTARVLDFLAPGVTILSGKFRILVANQSFCRLVGGTPDSVQGKLLAEVCPEVNPGLLLRGTTPNARGEVDLLTLIKGEGGGRSYRARLTEILHGDGDDGIFVLMLADAADTQQTQEDPAKFRKLYEKILETVTEAILLVDREGSVIDASPLAASMVAHTREELTGKKLQSLQEAPSGGAEPTLNSCFSSSWQLDGRVLKTRAVRKDGTAFSAEFIFREVGGGGRAGYLVKLRDVTQDELAESLSCERLRVIELIARNKPLESVLTGVAELVEHQMPESYCVVMLKRGERLVPAIAPRMSAGFMESIGDFSLDSVVASHTSAFVEGKSILFEDIAGRPAWDSWKDEVLRRGIRSSISTPVFSSEGLVVGLIAAYRPETEGPKKEHSELLQLASKLASVCIEQRELTDRLAYRAQHDSLTGLLNRLSFEERLRQAIAHAARHNRRLAVLSVDLDRFKLVNDTLGHEAGDELIKQLGARLVESLRETDIVARWGGDEFVIGLMEIEHRHDAEAVAEKLVDALKTPFDISGHFSTISASIGVSVYPDDGRDLDALVRHADTAMYRAKKGGRNGFYSYDAKLGETDRQRLEVESQLRKALDRGELSLHYQPQIDLRTRSLVGVEALLRWQNRELGPISPSVFIPIAEECGQIVPIGEWVIREACRGVKQLGLAGFKDIRVAVNVSGVQFARNDFVELVATTVGESGIEPRQLELELTESMLMEPGDESAPRMAKLRALGIKMSLDDFGTGFSSLSYLQRLPIDNLKIDRSFVQALDESSRTPLLVESIVALSAGLGMLSIAEGVELPSQLDVLSATGCNLVQGYLFSEPLPFQQLVTLIRKHNGGAWRPKLAPCHRRGPRIQEPVSISATAMAQHAVAG
jgi:diguanylate cyclase (GGDEF)-like protein/PAS domain S-box-containing protein